MGLAELGVKISADISEFEKGMQKIGSSTQKLGNNMKKIGTGMTLGLTAPIVGMATVGVKSFVDLETGLAKVSTMLDGTGKSMGDLEKETKELSGEFAMSQSEITEATYQAISAGVEATETQDFLTVALKASIGGFTDVTTATDGLTTVLNAYGLETADAEKIANQMLITQNKGKTTFGELSEAIGKVAPIAATCKVGTEDLFSSLAVLTAQGLSTSESVTGLKAVLSGVAKPTAEASEAANRLGVDFSAQAVEAKGLMPFLTEIKGKISTLSPEYAGLTKEIGTNVAKLKEMEGQGQKNTAEYDILAKSTEVLKEKSKEMTSEGGSQLEQFAKMFGSVEALNAIMMLTSEEGMALYQETSKSMEKDTEALDGAFQKMSDTTGVSLKQSLVHVQNALIEVGKVLAPFIAVVGNAIGTLAEIFGALPGPIQKVIMVIMGLVALAGPVLIFAGSVVSNITKIKNGIDLLRDSTGIISKMGGAFTTVGKLATGGLGLVKSGVISMISAIVPAIVGFGTTVAGVMTTIGTSMLALLANPVTWIILGIVALVAAGVALAMNWDEVCAWCSETWNKLSEFLGEMWENLKTAVGEFAKNQVAKFKEGFEGAKKAAGEGLTWIYEKHVEKFNEISECVGSGMDWINEKIAGVMNWINEKIVTKLEEIKQKWNDIFEGIKGICGTILDWIKGKVMEVVTGICSIFGFDLEKAKASVDRIFNDIKDTIFGIIDKAKNIVSNGIDKIIGFFDFEWSFPELKMPHFSMTGKFGFDPPSIPSFGIDWYDKGGVFSGPSVIGVGEKRPEFVGALDDLKTLMREVLNEDNNNDGGSTGGFALKIDTFINNREQDIEGLCEEIESYRRRRR